MQNRIINALQQARNASVPIHAHEKATWKLAKAALKHDKQLHWQLIQNPNRLRIMTIDALCLQLTHQAPLLSTLNNRHCISDKPMQLYQQAVTRILTELDSHEPFSQAIAQLLSHLDNRLDTLSELLVSMLSCREQWLGLIINIDDSQTQRHALETSLQHIIETAIKL